jgi:hypothetical protein
LDIQTIRGTAAQETLEEKFEQVGCGGEELLVQMERGIES